MPSTKDPFGEDAFLLHPANQNEQFARLSQVHYEAPIIKGVANRLKRWPSDLFFAFLAACLVIGGLLFLIFLTVAFCLPADTDDRRRIVRSFEIEGGPNVYFLKVNNRTWSTKDFCLIETAARKYSDVHVYLINIFREEPINIFDEQTENTTVPESKSNYSETGTKNYPKLTPEKQLQKQLISRNTNIRSIDVSVKRLFEGSQLSNAAPNFNDKMLESAGGAQLLWNSAGIIINPDMFCNLGTVIGYLCRNSSCANCEPDIVATIDPKNNIQATAVPCQAFMGFLLQEMWHNRTRVLTLREYIKKFCPPSSYCPELRLLDFREFKCPSGNFDCPTVYSSNVSLDDGDHENFIT